FLAATLALAHYTWVAPVATLEPGKPATIQISHGDVFPNGDEAINAAQVELYVLAPSGAKTKLTPAKSANTVTAPFTPRESGPHRLVMIQDRGVTSRTPQGVKQGGRDKNPTATQASRTYRTAVSCLNAKSAKPIGLELEFTAERTSSSWQVQLLKHGKPAPGIAIEVLLPGASKGVASGKTDAAGKFTWTPPANSKGPVLFSAMFKDAPPAGATFDAVNYETSLYLAW
ncbi:MAG: DUF4198 domain-containing protein, partial [Bryobacterales bacterium]|nr:DUF4198 domain-containing protein [Bryobacterales bacterium]